MAELHGEFIGLSKLHVAIGVEDSMTGYTSPAPMFLAPSASMSSDPQVAVKTRNYDNKAMFTTATEAETKVVFVVSGVDTVMAARLLGKSYDAINKRVIDDGKANNAPYCALSWRSDIQGGVKYYQFLKGRFAPFKEEAESTDKDIKEKTTTLEFTALTTQYEGFKVPNTAGDGYRTGGCKLITGDTRIDSTLTDIIWFGQVQKPEVYTAPSVLTAVYNPLASATAVVVTSKPTITFNNPIDDYSGISLLKADGTVVNATLSIDSANKVVTITPSANLTAATAHYIVVNGVTDVFNQKLPNASVKFTTA